MKILAFSVIAALLIGLIFTMKADSTSVTGAFAMKKLEASPVSDDTKFDPSKALFPTASEEKQTAGSAEENENTAEEEAYSEPEDELDPNQSWDAPGGMTPMAPGTQSAIQACMTIVDVYHKLQKKYPLTTPDAEVCAIADAENHGNICLGATRGQPCPVSAANAKGTFQVVDGTAKDAWKSLGESEGTYNPEHLENNMAVAIHYLDSMRKKHGENRFRAYNGGAAIKDGVPNYAKPGKVSSRTAYYDRWVRSKIPTYQAALEGKVDFSNAAVAVMSSVSLSPPIPYGEGYVSSLFGEPRDHGPHQGMDLACVIGTKVLAIADGKVAFAGVHNNTDSGRRAGVQVQLTHGDGTVGRLGGSRYFHLATVTVKDGDFVKAGQQIGTIGLTGVKNSGSHLHFESFTWGPGKKLVTYDVPGAWFPTIPFLPTAGNRYIGPKTPGAKSAAAKFERLAKR